MLSENVTLTESFNLITTLLFQIVSTLSVIQLISCNRQNQQNIEIGAAVEFYLQFRNISA